MHRTKGCKMHPTSYDFRWWSLVSNSRTGFGIAATRASSIDSHITAGSATRNNFFCTAIGCGVMLNLKWVKPCCKTFQGFSGLVSNPYRSRQTFRGLTPLINSGKHHMPAHTPVGGRFSNNTSPAWVIINIVVDFSGSVFFGRGAGNS